MIGSMENKKYYFRSYTNELIPIRIDMEHSELLDGPLKQYLNDGFLIVDEFNNVIETKLKIGFLFRLKSLWIGIHYSNYNKRFCINLLPCCTIYIVRKGGVKPNKLNK